MSEPGDGTPTPDDVATVTLPSLSPRGTRQQWTRSTVAALPDSEGTRSEPGAEPAFVVGTGHGVVRALDPDGAERWSVDLGGMAVAVEPTLVGDEPVVLVGTRGETAVLALLDAIEGTVRWTHDLEADVGEATRETLFYYPMTVALASDARAVAADGDRLYAAARRYERDGDDRLFDSYVYAFEPDGTVAWTYASDASPIAIDRRDDRLAVAFNRCHGDHQCGLVVLDADEGTLRSTWDPGTDGGRRVGDAALDADGVVVACHGDYRGYALDDAGRERWAVDLARPVDREEDTVYAYPNRVALRGDRALFLTGNSFPREGRDTAARHPNEHTLAVVERETGARLRDAPVEGWVGGTAGVGDDDTAAADATDRDTTIALAVGQHFRDRDPGSHGVRIVDPATGETRQIRTDGVAVGVAAAANRLAVLEEPIAYHDEERQRGSHRLRILSP